MFVLPSASSTATKTCPKNISKVLFFQGSALQTLRLSVTATCYMCWLCWMGIYRAKVPMQEKKLPKLKYRGKSVSRCVYISAL